MPTYNGITTTNLQDKALDWLVRKVNQERAAQTEARAAQDPPLPPLAPITKQQYIDAVLVDSSLNSYLAQYGERVGELVKEAYLAASGSIQGQVRTLLDVDPNADI